MGREVFRVPLDYDWTIKKEMEPPKGDGYQMWSSTIDEPITPVFKMKEDLAKYLVENEIRASGERTATYNEWLKMIDVGFAVSFVHVNGELISGVEALSREISK